jgi:hypothetical protein
MKAQILPKEIAVTHTTCEGREFLRFPIEGWNDAKQYVKKVLLFNGKRFVWSCWNSDTMNCHFRHDPYIQTAKIL